ncbi:hypothetical protein PIB30_038006 [Stylosanthes scabra]|uniref:Uncharacterized protein n=1 Tax=Stylosanthes scabra TaxID=79078 RepID=A0ABU6RDZ5_9FABA|nr:hypothetical protein [Stylosanthes scabra]
MILPVKCIDAFLLPLLLSPLQLLILSPTIFPTTSSSIFPSMPLSLLQIHHHTSGATPASTSMQARCRLSLTLATTNIGRRLVLSQGCGQGPPRQRRQWRDLAWREGNGEKVTELGDGKVGGGTCTESKDH